MLLLFVLLVGLISGQKATTGATSGSSMMTPPSTGSTTGTGSMGQGNSMSGSQGNSMSSPQGNSMSGSQGNSMSGSQGNSMSGSQGNSMSGSQGNSMSGSSQGSSTSGSQGTSMSGSQGKGKGQNGNAGQGNNQGQNNNNQGQNNNNQGQNNNQGNNNNPLTGGSRPGQCPILAPGTIGTCIAGCTSDDSCPQGQKCCSNGCGRTCQSASGSGGGGSTHPGQCPAPSGGITSCLATCTDDSSCAADEKCCSTGCGRACRRPGSGNGGGGGNNNTAPHPGQCPAPSGGITSCLATCNDDSSCPPDEKCCSTGCGRACRKPGSNGGNNNTAVHPGQCPAIRGGQLGTCIEACQGDMSCAQDEKCCSNGCGHTCQKVNNNNNNQTGGGQNQTHCTCGQPCTMMSGGSGVCQTDNKTCAQNIQAPQCGGNSNHNQTSCVCGQSCMTTSGARGYCQTDNKTCAQNIQAPQCGGHQNQTSNQTSSNQTSSNQTMCTGEEKPCPCQNGFYCLARNAMCRTPNSPCPQSCAVNQKSCPCASGQYCLALNAMCLSPSSPCPMNNQTSTSCTCGQPCMMASGGSGVCQTDGKTCAVNVRAPQCNNGKGKGKGKGAACSSNSDCRGNQRCVMRKCAPAGKAVGQQSG